MYAEWPATEGVPVLEITSRFSTRDRLVDVSKPASTASEDPAVLGKYLKPTALIPSTASCSRPRSRSSRARRPRWPGPGRSTEWIVDNTFRDPKVKGCGLGDIKTMPETRYLGGKCADLDALYVGLARAAGLPARDVYRVRCADSAELKSLGKSGGDISKAQHCRAEVYLTGHGWMPVDPAAYARTASTRRRSATR